MNRPNVEKTTRQTLLPALITRESNEELRLQALSEGLGPTVASVLSRRSIQPGQSLTEFLSANLARLDHPKHLKDIHKAASRIAEAVIEKEVIGLEADYDQDGLGAMSVLKLSFTEHFNHASEKTRSYIGHRLRDGYGLCDPIVDRILGEANRPSILITADNGSSDQERIKRLNDEGIDVIVTDHHAIPTEGPPKDAFAFINPQQETCEYPDGAIAGGMVAWLLMCVVRSVLLDRGHVSGERNTLVSLLDYVACSTVADCVNMASVNNRAVVRRGLRLMNDNPRSCWKGMRSLLKTSEITAETISFGIAPRVNAQTRLNSADDALTFLLASSANEAEIYARRLDKNNEERKLIERGMVDTAIELAESQTMDGRKSIVTLLAEGHPGVQGICSSRILERYGRTTFTFCPNVSDDGIITGSGRAVDDIHLRNVLQRLDEQLPGVMLKFGGHKAAAGVTIKMESFDAFSEMFEQLVSLSLNGQKVGPKIFSDGCLAVSDISLATLDELGVMEPIGRGFDAAQFDGTFTVAAIKPVGDGTHLKVSLEMKGNTFSGIWFRARRSASEQVPVCAGEPAHFVYRLMDNAGYGRRKLQIQIIGLVRRQCEGVNDPLEQ